MLFDLLNNSNGNVTDSLFIFLIAITSVVIAISIHEAAHAFTAYKLGDLTPKIQGRLTLNPLKHLDLMGTVLIIIAGIGWGRPVEFNPYNLKNPRRDSAIIALAGPVSNIVLASLLSIIIKVFPDMPFVIVLIYLIRLNIYLALFNMIPIEPLDGFKVVGGILPKHLYFQWEETKKYGFLILIFLLVTGAISRIITPFASVILSFLI